MAAKKTPAQRKAELEARIKAIDTREQIAKLRESLKPKKK